MAASAYHGWLVFLSCNGAFMKTIWAGGNPLTKKLGFDIVKAPAPEPRSKYDAAFDAVTIGHALKVNTENMERIYSAYKGYLKRKKIKATIHQKKTDDGYLLWVK